MRLDDDHGFGDTKTGSKAHVVAFDAPPSPLILGSDNYDDDTHRRALCGTISEFTQADEPDDQSGYCYACVRTGVARGYIDDPSPFDEDDVRDRERHTSDRHQTDD